MKWNSGRLWLRITVYGSMTLAALFIIAQMLILWQFDENAIRNTISGSLRDLHRQVSVAGKISPVIFPSPASASTN